MHRFLDRHPEISKRTPENVDFQHAGVSKELPQRAKSGFRMSGPVPSNSANLEYTKLQISESEDSIQRQRREYVQRRFENVGLLRAMNAFESTLQESEITLFKKRLSEGHDVKGDKSTTGRLWAAYKALHSCVSTDERIEGNAELVNIQEMEENHSARTKVWPDGFVQFETDRASEEEHERAISVEKSYYEGYFYCFLNHYTVFASKRNLKASTGNKNNIFKLFCSFKIV